jgi:hypothetical protein
LSGDPDKDESVMDGRWRHTAFYMRGAGFSL